MSKALMSAGHSLVAVQDNLIDAIWTERPERPSTQLRVLGLEYTGQWARTLDRRSVVVSKSVDVFVVWRARYSGMA